MSVRVRSGRTSTASRPARIELRNCEIEIENYAAGLRQQFVIRWNADGTGTLLTTNLRVLQQAINRLEAKSAKLLRDTYSKLTPWQKAQVARHPDRPHFKDYVAGAAPMLALIVYERWSQT